MNPLTIDAADEAENLWLEARLREYGNPNAVRNLSELDGYLTAVISSPQQPPIDRWWPAIWAGSPPCRPPAPAWPSRAEQFRHTAPHALSIFNTRGAIRRPVVGKCRPLRR